MLFDRRWAIFIPAVTDRAEQTFLGLILKPQNIGEPSADIFMTALGLKLAHPIFLCYSTSVLGQISCRVL